MASSSQCSGSRPRCFGYPHAIQTGFAREILAFQVGRQTGKNLLRKEIGETLLRMTSVRLDAVKLPAGAARIAARENGVEPAQGCELLPGTAAEQGYHGPHQCGQVSRP